MQKYRHNNVILDVLNMIGVQVLGPQFSTAVTIPAFVIKVVV